MGSTQSTWGSLQVSCRMNLYNWIKENQFLRLKCKLPIEISSVNERLKVIIKEKWNRTWNLMYNLLEHKQ